MSLVWRVRSPITNYINNLIRYKANAIPTPRKSLRIKNFSFLHQLQHYTEHSDYGFIILFRLG